MCLSGSVGYLGRNNIREEPVFTLDVSAGHEYTRIGVDVDEHCNDFMSVGEWGWEGSGCTYDDGAGRERRNCVGLMAKCVNE